MPLADLALRAALNDRGVEGDWTFSALDLGGAQLEDVRLGPQTSPTLTAETLAVRFAWRGVAPSLAAVEAEKLVLTVHWSEAGFDLGAIEPFLGADRQPARPSPRIAANLRNATVRLVLPMGVVAATGEASGVLTRDFAANAVIVPTSLEGEGGALSRLEGTLAVRTAGEALAADLQASLASTILTRPEIAGQALRLTGRGEIAHDRSFSRAAAELVGRRLAVGPYAAQAPILSASFEAGADGRWTAALTHAAAGAGLAGVALDRAGLRVDLEGKGQEAAGTWRVTTAAATSLGVISTGAGAEGAIKASWREKPSILIEGTAKSMSAGLPAQERAAFVRGLPSLAGLPPGPLMADARSALDRALADFSWAAPVRLTVEGAATAFSVPGRVELRAKSGATLDAAARVDAPLVYWPLPDGAATLAGEAALRGDGLPALDIAVRRMVLGPEGAIDATVRLAPWQVEAARLAAPELTVRGPFSAIVVDGTMEMSGPAGALEIKGLQAPLALQIASTDAGLRVAPRNGAPATIEIAAIEGALGRFEDIALTLSPRDGAFFSADGNGRLGGGFALGAVQMAGPAATLRWDGVRVDLTGDARAPLAAFTVTAPEYASVLATERRLEIAGAALAGTAAFPSGAPWRVEGVFDGATVNDPGLPVHVTALRLPWSAAPDAAGEAVIRFAGGEARVTDKEAAPRFEPFAIADIEGEFLGGKVKALGAVRLAAGQQPLAAFESTHDFASGAGEAHVLVRRLTFSSALELDKVTPLARGVVAGVRGPVDGDFAARWGPDQFATTGTLTLDGIDAATLGLGPIEGISGTIAFDDLALLTTPPGQSLSIASINPGVAVRDGVVRFQLKENATVALEEARFPFAQGVLSVAPTEIVIGAERTDYRLRLSEIDMAALVGELRLKDLTATGTAEGEFPLIISPRGARIENGLLTASPGGGVIAYTGAFGADQTGPARLAFDALKSFRYDSLSLTFNGDLDGEIVSEIKFGGVNMAPVNPGIAIPGAARMSGTEGLPFRFNVTVRAPFQALLNEAARLADPLKRLDDARKPSLDPAQVP
jgi:hypothetical protein